MASRILCPQCETAFAYSPALLGKTVKCRQCQHTFLVSRPPADAAPAPESPAPAKTVVPPPLPARVVADRRSRRRENDDRRREDDPPRSRRREAEDEEPPVVRRRADRPVAKSSGTGVLIGLIAVSLVGVLGIGGGIAWAVWPKKTTPTALTQTAAAPVTPPVAEKPPENLDDILKKAPKRDPNPPIRIDPPVAKQPEPDPFPPPAPPPRPKRPPVRDPGLPPELTARPPEPKVGPDFVPVTSLSIQPPALTKAIEERKLPGPAEYGVLAAGGKLILLHIPREKKLAVFDVTTAKVEKWLDVTDPKPMVAAGMNQILVYQPEKNAVDRYNTRTLEKEATVPARFPGDVVGLGMGSATNGPLVAVLKGARATFHGGGTVAFFDPVSLKELDYQIGGEENPFGIGIHGGEVAVRVSADGSVATGWNTGHNPGTEIITIDGTRATRSWRHGRGTPLFPAADGRTLYGPGGLFNPDGTQIGGGGERFPRREQVHYVPAAHGDFVLGLTPQGGFDRRPPKAEVFLGRETKSLHWFGDMPEAQSEQNPFGEPKQPYDRHLFLIPEAKLLVAIDGADKTKVMLHKVDLDEALAKTDVEYVYVSSRPPAAATPGQSYRYVPTVKAKKPGWKVTVESGPKGMVVGSDGAVSWDVPKDFAEPDVGVILKFAAGSKETYQTVRIKIAGKKAK